MPARFRSAGIMLLSSAMRAGNITLGARLRVVLDREVAIGPGKAAILRGVKETGSIAAAGRRMRMSYKRAWRLVETLNQLFHAPLVEASKGGKAGGGAALTPLGEEVLMRYERMVTLTEQAIEPEMRALRGILAASDR